MPTHSTSGKSALGIQLTLLTAVMWGLLPIALKEVLVAMDSWTIVWYRFLVAAILLGGWMSLRGQLPARAAFSRPVVKILLLAVCLSSTNYISYMLSLEQVDPSAAQVLIQLAPMLLLIGGVWVFKEPFTRSQTVGALILVLGLLLFFNERLLGLLDFGAHNSLLLGIGFMFLAAVTWAGYGLCQKWLLNALSSQQVMLLLYLLAAMLFFPLADPVSVLQLDRWQLLMLLFCCLNTLVAYGAFAEALNHWEASKVSALVTLAPLFTILFMELLVLFWPQNFQPENLNLLAYLGAFVVVFGSFLASRGR